MDGALLDRLPPELRAAAWSAVNGELAWPAGQVEAVARWCAEHRLAVVGGEIYEVLPGTQWGSFRQDWLVAPAWRPGGDWAAFVRRALGDLTDVLAGIGADHCELKVFLATLSPDAAGAGIRLPGALVKSTSDGPRSGLATR
ncbi:hypothetical protein [Amycolatopsis thermoflava]|uniref:Uncharacterized protein n=1 Tax=Amycolatopsis thermoflava TaxID=84480 RepID=A0A3N2GPJ6_9PSEU|nr:hypothetical protein [Amycolatopsis thermoflava]ROS38433.1 hypothetical protein EDD35_0709 [Amycolatopsis thermoflava]